jgi:RNA polymerase sigma-70 factor (ECF subfamily)
MNSFAFTPSLFSFDTFYRENVAAVRRMVARYQFRDAAADDVVQDIFLQAWRKHEQVREPAAMRSWLLTIARHHCINQRKQEKVFLSLTTAGDPSEADIDLDRFWSTESQEDGAHFELALSLLREVIEMHQHTERKQVAHAFYVDCKSVKDISMELGLTSNTVLSHLRRFRLVAAEALLALAEEKGCEQEKVLTSRR